MTNLKLAKLPDRTPTRIAISVAPELNRALHAYAELYREAYGDSVSAAELIPFMLESFLDNDRGFAKARREKRADSKASMTGVASASTWRQGRFTADSPPSTRVEK